MIDIYINESCQDCKTLILLLKKHNIIYNPVDVSTIEGFTGELPSLILNGNIIITGLKNIRRQLYI